MPYPQRKMPEDDDPELTDLAKARFAAQGKAGKTPDSGVFDGVTGAGRQDRPPALDRSPPSLTDEADAAIGRRDQGPQRGAPPPVAGADPYEQAKDAAKRKAHDETMAATNNGATAYDPNAGAPPVGTDPEFDQFAKEREAARQQLEADKARQLQGVGARAGVGGFGLFGGTSTALQDTANVADRNETNSLADLDKKQRDEKFLRLREKALTDELEYDEDTDIDGDGTIAGQKVGGNIGDGDPTNNDDKGKTKPKPKDKHTAAGDAAGVVDDVAKYFGAPNDLIKVVAPGDAPKGDGFVKLPWPGSQLVYLDTTTGQIYVVQA
jgi:hypothetical protein